MKYDTNIQGLELIEAKFGKLDAVKNRIKQHSIETCSWAYGDAGTRYYTYRQPGTPRNTFEKLEDAATVNRFTGVARSVALHIPWDKVQDFNELRAFAANIGLKIGAINPNVFQGDDYKLGSITNESKAIRVQAIDHMLECIEIAQTLGSPAISIWLGDGTNFPGQGDFRRRKQYLLDSLQTVYKAMPENMRMFLEYKLFEPAFYHTDICDWGIAYVLAQHIGDRAEVLVDLGHHALGVNIEHIVAMLIDEGKLGGFHFNNKKYADDDLTVGSINPYELFLIYNELAAAEADPNVDMSKVVYAIDQCHTLKGKIEEMIQSVVNCQIAYAKALLVNRSALCAAQVNGDVLGAEAILHDAYQTDVRPLLAQVRIEMGLDPDPLMAFRTSGHIEKICSQRK